MQRDETLLPVDEVALVFVRLVVDERPQEVLRCGVRPAQVGGVRRPVPERSAQVPQQRADFVLAPGVVALVVVDLIGHVAEQFVQAEALGPDLVRTHDTTPPPARRIPFMLPTPPGAVQSACAQAPGPYASFPARSVCNARTKPGRMQPAGAVRAHPSDHTSPPAPASTPSKPL